MMRFYDFIINDYDNLYDDKVKIANLIDHAYVDMVDGVNITVKGLIGQDSIAYSKIAEGVFSAINTAQSANHYENIAFNVSYDQEMLIIEVEMKFD